MFTLDPVNVALVGCGAVSELYYQPALAELERHDLLRVKALLDPNAQRRQQLNTYFPEAIQVEDVSELHNSDLDLAIVASPPRYHAEQTIQLLEAFREYEIFFVTYNSVRNEEVESIAPAHFSENIGWSPVRMAKAFLWSLWVLQKERPQAIVSLGSEIAIPFFFWSWVLGLHSLYIESWSRVKTQSGTGKIVSPLAEKYWVQWLEMLDICGPKAEFKGSVI